MGKTYYTIEQAARELGISKQTIVRYEKRGLLPKARRNPINKWREYTLRDIKTLKKILGRI
jgi:DNA-binding transcriptional MerR regulator